MDWIFAIVRIALLWLVVAASCVLIYLLAAVEAVWVYTAVIAAQRAAFTINLAGFGLALIDRSKALAICSAIFLLAMGTYDVLGWLDCTVSAMGGGGSRLSNCGSYALLALGLANAAVLALFQRKAAVLIGLGGIVCLPFSFWVADRHFGGPLRAEIASLELQSICVLQVPRHGVHPPTLKGATRVRHFAEMDLGRVIGEESPRIYRITDTNVSVWRYAKRAFTDDIGDWAPDPSDLRAFCAVQQ